MSASARRCSPPCWPASSLRPRRARSLRPSCSCASSAPTSTHAPASDWIPLASAPVFNYIGGYQIGYRLQQTGANGNFQTRRCGSRACPTACPPSRRTRRRTASGATATRATSPPRRRDSVRGQRDLQRSPSRSGPSPPGNGCVARPGRRTTGSFSVDAHVAPQLIGRPFAFRARPLPGDAFVGIRAARSARRLRRQQLRAGRHRRTRRLRDRTQRSCRTDDDPPRQRDEHVPGAGDWTCVGRGVVEGQNDSSERTLFGTPWSAPLRFDVLSDFQRKKAAIVHPRSTRPTFEVEAAVRRRVGGRRRPRSSSSASCAAQAEELRVQEARDLHAGRSTPRDSRSSASSGRAKDRLLRRGGDASAARASSARARTRP